VARPLRPLRRLITRRAVVRNPPGGVPTRRRYPPVVATGVPVGTVGPTGDRLEYPATRLTLDSAIANPSQEVASAARFADCLASLHLPKVHHLPWRVHTWDVIDLSYVAVPYESQRIKQAPVILDAPMPGVTTGVVGATGLLACEDGTSGGQDTAKFPASLLNTLRSNVLEHGPRCYKPESAVLKGQMTGLGLAEAD